MRKGYALKRDGERWFDFEVEDETSELYILKIITGEGKGKYSFVFKEELDKTIILEDNKQEGK